MFLIQKIPNEWLDIYTKIQEVKGMELYMVDDKMGKWLPEQSWEVYQQHEIRKENKNANYKSEKNSDKNEKEPP